MKHFLIIFVLLPFSLSAQHIYNEDSALILENVIVKAYEQNRSLINVAAPVSVIGQSQLNRFGNLSILPAVNICFYNAIIIVARGWRGVQVIIISY